MSAAVPETDDVTELLRRQHGLITRAQARSAGLTDGRIRTLRDRGRWEALAPDVFGLVGHHRTWVRQLWIAVLHAGPGSAVSRESAARLDGVEEVPEGLVVVSVGAHRRPRGGVARWHRVQDLTPLDIVVRDGLPMTTPVRTVVDLAGVLRVARLRILVERGVVERRFTLDQLGAAVGRLRRRGRPGIATICGVLDDLGPGADIPNGELERLADRAVVLAGLPLPVHEHPLPGVGPRAGFVDRCWPEARMILEADGRRWHGRRQQMVADNDRTLQAQTAGYETTRLLWEHLSSDAEGTARALRLVYERRLELVARGA